MSYKIVGRLFEVYNELGYGYQEKYYERALSVLFNKNKVNYKRQASFKIIFRDKIIGRYTLDFIIDNKIVLELKKGNYFSKNNIEQIKV